MIELVVISSTLRCDPKVLQELAYQIWMYLLNDSFLPLVEPITPTRCPLAMLTSSFFNPDFSMSRTTPSTIERPYESFPSDFGCLGR